jgi:hypothetical protein
MTLDPRAVEPVMSGDGDAKHLSRALRGREVYAQTNDAPAVAGRGAGD